MVAINKQIPSTAVPFVIETKDSFGKPFYTINQIWYNFLYSFSVQAVSVATGSGMLALDSGTGFVRTLTAGDNKISIANGTGATANPTFTINDSNLSISYTQITGVTLSSGASLSGSNTGDQTITLTGDVTGSGTGSFSATIANGVVSNAKLAGSIASSKLIGTDIATVGTVTSGTWSASTIAVDKGGTGQTSYTNGQLLIGNTTGNTLTKATLSAGSGISITNGSGSITIAATGSSGACVQQVRQTRGSVGTGTTVIPGDNTIPQNTEGDEYITVAITPTNSSNILVIKANAHASHSTALGVLIAALFQDSTANALSAGMSVYTGASYIVPIVLYHTMTAGTTSSTTFKLRVGSNQAGTTTLNGGGGAGTLGGVLISSLEVTEWTA